MVVKIKKFDELSEKWEEVKQKLSHKQKTIEGTDKMQRIKKKLAIIKTEWFKLEQRIGIIRTTIGREHEEIYAENHHLYDSIDDFEI